MYLVALAIQQKLSLNEKNYATMDINKEEL